MTPDDNSFEYPYFSITGIEMRPIATTDAPTTPVAAANSAPTNTTAIASPPRTAPKS